MKSMKGMKWYGEEETKTQADSVSVYLSFALFMLFMVKPFGHSLSLRLGGGADRMGWL